MIRKVSIYGVSDGDKLHLDDPRLKSAYEAIGRRMAGAMATIDEEMTQNALERNLGALAEGTGMSLDSVYRMYNGNLFPPKEVQEFLATPISRGTAPRVMVIKEVRDEPAVIIGEAYQSSYF